MNMYMLDKINFHDADIYNYIREGNDIFFELKDGWNEDTYYKIKLNNVRVEIMDNDDDLVAYILDTFNNINENGSINLYSGDGGRVEEVVDGRKYYLKLWIRHPYDMNIKIDNIISDYKFDGMDVEYSDDYDDTGRLFIKFIASDIDIIELYPLLKKYNSGSIENMNNLYKYRSKFGDKEFKFFSVYDLSCFINNILENRSKCCNCIRIVDYVDDKYVVGFLKSFEEEFTFNCSDIVYEGDYLNSRGFFD